jgi:hypothetical protein
MPKPGSTTFEKPYVLVVEGKDDFGFFLGLLDDLNIHSVHIAQIDGIQNLAPRLKLFLKTAGWSDVRRLGIFVDSDHDPAARHQAIRSALQGATLAVPPEPGQAHGAGPEVLFSTLPSPNATGCLETLVFESVPAERQQCIEQFMDCAGVVDDGVSGRFQKSRVHAFISSSAGAGNKLGEAVNAGVIDVTSPAFDPIRDLLRALVA